MSKHTIEVRQLETYGGAFFNVNDNIYGHLEIWGSCYDNPTYFVRAGSTEYHLFTFDNQAFADEYFKEYGHYYTEITKIEPK